MGEIVRLYPKPTSEQLAILWERYRAAKQLSIEEPTTENIQVAARAWVEFYQEFRRA